MNSSNESILIELNEQINQHAHVREYLMMFINNLSINTPDDVLFQASILSKLTETTNQLTRKTSVKVKISFFLHLILFIFLESCIN